MNSSSTLARDGRPRDAIVSTNRHHATPRSSLSTKPVEFRLEIVRIHGRAEVPSFIVHDVVHVERVGHHGERFVAHVNQERLVAAYVVNVVYAAATEEFPAYEECRAARKR